jgi:hypothetical protein
MTFRYTGSHEKNRPGAEVLLRLLNRAAWAVITIDERVERALAALGMPPSARIRRAITAAFTGDWVNPKFTSGRLPQGLAWTGR